MIRPAEQSNGDRRSSHAPTETDLESSVTHSHRRLGRWSMGWWLGRDNARVRGRDRDLKAGMNEFKAKEKEEENEACWPLVLDPCQASRLLTNSPRGRESSPLQSGSHSPQNRRTGDFKFPLSITALIQQTCLLHLQLQLPQHLCYYVQPFVLSNSIAVVTAVGRPLLTRFPQTPFAVGQHSFEMATSS